ncbi:MAG: ATP-binding protein [Anaerolineae bacterium]
MTTDKVYKLIARGEGPTIEFKREWPQRGDVTAEIGSELVAFANTQGGYLLIGVDDNGLVVGVTGDWRKLEERLMGICRVCSPPVVLTVEEVAVEGKSILVAHVPEGTDKPYRVRDICYVRVGSTAQHATREEERWMFQESGEILFERTPLWEAAYEDLDTAKIRRYFKQRSPEAAVSTSEIVNTERPLHELVELADLPLIARRGDQLAPTVAAMLLFGRRPQYFLPQAFVSAARFPGLDLDVTAIDRDTFRGTVDELIEQSTAFVRRNMRTASILEDEKLPRRTDIPEYPLRAVREAITNACVHRDYSRWSQEVAVRMFDDRLEIFSPGGLVRGMTVQDLGTGKYAARNPTLAEVMREMGLIERFGTGIRMMRREMETLGSAPPIFVVDENSFTVTLPVRELELWRNEGRRRYEVRNA